jgi:hypothetical protein
MLFVLINWLIIFVSSYPIGRIVNIRIKNDINLVQNVIVGLIFNSIIMSTLAFFMPINSNILYGLCLLNTSLLVFDFSYYKKLIATIKQRLNTKQLFMLFFASIVLAIYSAAYSKINDDGLYYTQTIKWLGEYGFVHGISNLHVSLGLSSAWHILQSVYIFSDSVYTNDLNGFVFLIYTFLIVSRIANKTITLFSITQYSVVLFLSVPFLSAPNPDFPVIVFTAIALDLVMLKENYKGILLIACFGITIKISAIFLLCLGGYCFFMERKKKIASPFLLLMIAAIFTLHISKNIFQTGYPLYPIKAFSINQLDWITPEPVIDYFIHGIKSWSYSDEYKPLEVENQYKKDIINELILLLGRGGTKGLINKFILGTALISLMVFVREGIRKRLSFKESIMLIFGFLNFIIWLLFAPQYRFILPVFVFFISLLIYYAFDKPIIKNNNWVINFLIGFYSIMFLVCLFGINISSGSTSKEIGQVDRLTSETLILPASQYVFNDVDSILINNKYYYHPTQNRCCWNVSLPCMSIGYEKVMLKDFHLRISQRTENLKDGFTINNQ